MCGEKDIFDDDPLTDSQLMAVVNAPTPVDPVVPVRSAETEEALQPAPNFDWVWEFEDRDSTHLEHCLEVQEEGQGDPSLSPSPVGPLPKEGSRKEVEQWSYQSEPSDKFQEIFLEAQRIASFQATLDCISGSGSKPQGVSKHKLGYVGERMLHDWYQPE